MCVLSLYRNHICIAALFVVAMSGCGQQNSLPPMQNAPQAETTHRDCGISIEMANQIHLAMLARIARAFQGGDLGVVYGGVLALDDGRGQGQRVHGSIGDPYVWTIVGADGVSVFDVTVSLESTAEDDVVAPVAGEMIYVRVSRIESRERTPSGMDKTRENLGGKSIRQLLQDLKTPTDEEGSE